MNENVPRRINARTLLAAATCLMVFSPSAHAYMDPGSMSVIVTAVLGAIAAVGYTARLYWERVKGFLRRLLGRDRAKDADE